MSRVNVHSTVGSGAGESWAARRIILTVSSTDSFPECLVYAIEREFPSIVVEQATGIEAACAPFEHPVCLVLIDTELLHKIDGYAAELMRHHPAAPIVLVQHDSRASVSMHDVLDLKIVRSVLPMDLKLDVWLSVIRLMLRGGEYFPLAMFQSYARSLSQKASDHSTPAEQPRPDRSGFEEMGELTDREFQILEMVARGLQNKIIAATLRLSEHTVKIHLHNIITKLGAHNRTEAAAVFHARKDSFHGGLERSGSPQSVQSSP
ncbi:MULTISPECIES: response regulator transcription factor [unclassified Mesorhizobium]|uniref:helix-turn-helix transcriptional regulator n=1 Tax=unclassified Mesorhizobium TaxID=325217 RepID=UPI0007FD01E2|nr:MULTISPECIES: response regulator transcription factor [unclassified Mesorhizobium]OBQ79279.1 helix-turn-helix transcriptional regulator [Mesorhizobium sp. WSM3873]